MRHAFVTLAALGFFSPMAGAQSFAPPTGIYVLGPAADNLNTPQDERLNAFRDYAFVSGYTLRVFWRDIEPTQDAYNFGVIDQALHQASLRGQRINLEILQGAPGYVVSGAGATYVNTRGETTPVPWDPFAMSRYAALEAALASHVVPDGAALPLNQHPVLANVDASPVGLNLGVRDLNHGITTSPTYTQQAFLNAVVQGVAASRNAFPNHQGSLAFFGMTDGQPGVPLDQQLIALLAAQYNHPGQPTLAFFIENLSDVGPVPIGASGGTGNNLLSWISLGGSSLMQALDSWQQHTPDREPQLASHNPATGISLAFDTYGTRFFELYVSDLDGAANGATDAAGRPLLPDLESWSRRLIGACNPDLNQDGATDQGDVDYLINVVAGGNNPGGIDPDFNHDGAADQGDIDALVNVIAGGQCP